MKKHILELLKAVFRYFGYQIEIQKPITNTILIEDFKQFIQIGVGTIIDRKKIILRSEMESDFLQIGDNSVVEAEFIFETNSGKIQIGNRSYIGGSTFICIENIRVGDDVMISWGCTLVDNNAHSLRWEDRKNDITDWKKGIDEGKTGKYKAWEKVGRKSIIIEDKVWVGFNSIILKGVRIGEGAIIGAGSVVTKDVEPFTVVAGNPAKFVKKIYQETNDKF